MPFYPTDTNKSDVIYDYPAYGLLREFVKIRVCSEKEKSFRVNFLFFTKNIFLAKFRFNLWLEKMQNFRKIERRKFHENIAYILQKKIFKYFLNNIYVLFLDLIRYLCIWFLSTSAQHYKLCWIFLSIFLSLV